MKLKVLIVGLDQFGLGCVNNTLTGAEFQHLGSAEDFGNAIETLNEQSADLVVCGSAIPEINVAEMGQAFRAQIPGAKIILLPLQNKAVDFKGLARDGFDEVFLLPADHELLGEFLRQVERERTGKSQQVYRSVPVMDFEPETELDFSISIFLPMNKKHVKILKQGSAITKNQIDKFKSHNVSSLCVEEGELSKFITYSAQQLKKQSREAKSNLVQSQKFKNTVRELFRNLLSDANGDFQTGKSLMENSQKIVAEFVDVRGATALHEKLMSGQAQDDQSVFAHCGRVSSIAALLALATGVGKPEDLSVAGLFHDLGKVAMRPETLGKELSGMSSEEKKEYTSFPEESLRILQQNKMGVSEKVRDLILQQCERPDGTGFPKQLKAHKIHPETQILVLANALDEMLSVKAGQKKLSPAEALEKIYQDGLITVEVMNAVKPLVAGETKAA